MQRLTAELTEAVHLSQGHTRLYLATEPLENPAAAVTDKACNSTTNGNPSPFSMLRVLGRSKGRLSSEGGLTSGKLFALRRT